MDKCKTWRLGIITCISVLSKRGTSLEFELASYLLIISSSVNGHWWSYRLRCLCCSVGLSYDLCHDLASEMVGMKNWRGIFGKNIKFR
jgi:hypothetical protein